MQIAKTNGLDLMTDAALDWISNSKSNWLMIFDSADIGYEIVGKFIPSGNKGNILITSRDPQLGRITSFANSLEVDQMSINEAISLLMKCGNLPAFKDSVKEVALELGCIPLAIDQAGAYMQACQCDPDDYMELFIKHKDQMMLDSFMAASDYRYSAFGTWEISVKEIENRAKYKDETQAKTAQSALFLLGIFAFLHHENISEDIFRKAAECYVKRDLDMEQKRGLLIIAATLDNKDLHLNEKGEWDRFLFHAAMKMLLSFSLVRGNLKLYTMHPLVHAWTRIRLNDSEQASYCSKTRALLACSIECTGSTDNLKWCGKLVKHVKACHVHISHLKLDEMNYDDEMKGMAFMFENVGEWNKAEEIQRRLLARRTKLSDDATICDTKHTLAHIYTHQGRYNEAEKLLLEILQLMKDAVNANHKYPALHFANSLAVVYHYQHKWDESEKLLLSLLKAYVEKLDEYRLKAMDILALTYLQQNRLQEAEIKELEVIEGYKEISELRSLSANSILPMCNLAQIYRRQQKYNEAEELLVQALQIQEEKLGPDHQQTLYTMGCLVQVYSKWGKHLDRANDLALAAVNGMNKAFGEMHPTTLWCTRELHRLQNISSARDKKYCLVLPFKIL